MIIKYIVKTMAASISFQITIHQFYKIFRSTCDSKGMRSTSLQPLPLEKWELPGWRIVFCAVFRSFCFFLSRLFFCSWALFLSPRTFFFTCGIARHEVINFWWRACWALTFEWSFYFLFLCFTRLELYLVVLYQL